MTDLLAIGDDFDAAQRNGLETSIAKRFPNVCAECVRDTADEIEALAAIGLWTDWADYLASEPEIASIQVLECGCCDHGWPESDCIEPMEGSEMTEDLGRPIPLDWQCKTCKRKVVQ